MVAAEVTRRMVAHAGQEIRLVTSSATGPWDFGRTSSVGVELAYLPFLWPFFLCCFITVRAAISLARLP